MIRLFQHYKEIELDWKKVARDLVENTQVRQFFRFSVKRVFFFLDRRDTCIRDIRDLKIFDKARFCSSLFSEGS